MDSLILIAARIKRTVASLQAKGNQMDIPMEHYEQDRLNRIERKNKTIRQKDLEEIYEIYTMEDNDESATSLSGLYHMSKSAVLEYLRKEGVYIPP